MRRKDKKLEPMASDRAGSIKAEFQDLQESREEHCPVRSCTWASMGQKAAKKNKA